MDIKKHAEQHDEINNVDIAKFYPASFWHDSVELVASRRALLRIRDAIDAALDEGRGRADLMEADGEGYALHVLREDRTWEQWCELPLHYGDKELTGPHNPEQWNRLSALLANRLGLQKEEGDGE